MATLQFDGEEVIDATYLTADDKLDFLWKQAQGITTTGDGRYDTTSTPSYKALAEEGIQSIRLVENDRIMAQQIPRPNFTGNTVSKNSYSVATSTIQNQLTLNFQTTLTGGSGTLPVNVGDPGLDDNGDPLGPTSTSSNTSPNVSDLLAMFGSRIGVKPPDGVMRFFFRVPLVTVTDNKYWAWRFDGTLPQLQPNQTYPLGSSSDPGNSSVVDRATWDTPNGYDFAVFLWDGASYVKVSTAGENGRRAGNPVLDITSATLVFHSYGMVAHNGAIPLSTQDEDGEKAAGSDYVVCGTRPPLLSFYTYEGQMGGTGVDILPLDNTFTGQNTFHMVSTGGAYSVGGLLSTGGDFNPHDDLSAVLVDHRDLRNSLVDMEFSQALQFGGFYRGSWRFIVSMEDGKTTLHIQVRDTDESDSWTDKWMLLQM